MRVSIQKSTGRLIEAQSGGGQDHLQALIDNAARSGIPGSDIEARVVTDQEYVALLAAAPKSEQEEDQRKAEKLQRIDLASIRAIREYIAAKSDASQEVKDREAEAIAERAKNRGELR